MGMHRGSRGRRWSPQILAACVLQLRSLLSLRNNGQGKNVEDQCSGREGCHGVAVDVQRQVSSEFVGVPDLAKPAPVPDSSLQHVAHAKVQGVVSPQQGGTSQRRGSQQPQRISAVAVASPLRYTVAVARCYHLRPAKLVTHSNFEVQKQRKNFSGTGAYCTTSHASPEETSPGSSAELRKVMVVRRAPEVIKEHKVHPDAQKMNVQEATQKVADNSEFMTNLKTLFGDFQTPWKECEKRLRSLWTGYTSQYIKRGHFVEFSQDDDGEEYLGVVRKVLEDEMFEISYVDENKQPTGETVTLHSEDFTSSDSLLNTVPAMISNACVQSFARNVSNKVKEQVRQTNTYFHSLFNRFLDSGVVTMHLSIGFSHPDLVGAGMLALMHRSLRHEGTMSVAIWPESVRGSVIAAGCRGKDTMHLSSDLKVGLALSFDRSCFDGTSVEVEGALQLEHSQEATMSMSFGMEPDGHIATKCFGDACFPAIDEISINYGGAAKGNAPSPWNIINKIASFSSVQCWDHELYAVGERDCESEGESEGEERKKPSPARDLRSKVGA